MHALNRAHAARADGSTVNTREHEGEELLDRAQLGATGVREVVGVAVLDIDLAEGRWLGSGVTHGVEIGEAQRTGTGGCIAQETGEVL